LKKTRESAIPGSDSPISLQPDPQLDRDLSRRTEHGNQGCHVEQALFVTYCTN